MRLGVALRDQLPECSIDADGAYVEFAGTAGARPCWKRGGDWHDLLLPWAEFRSLGLRITRFEAHEAAGVVDEIAFRCEPGDWKRLERILRSRYGDPTETERYERDSRVLGRSNHVEHTWRGTDGTIFFLELTGGEETEARAVPSAR